MKKVLTILMIFILALGPIISPFDEKGPGDIALESRILNF